HPFPTRRSSDLDHLLRAAGALSARGAPIDVELVGDGPERAALTALARDLGLAERVRFRGWLPFAEVRQAMSRATILVHPSPGLGDGLPNVLREAMAVGTPVVASRVAGIPEALDDGRCGALVPPADVAGLADAMAGVYAYLRALRDRVRGGEGPVPSNGSPEEPSRGLRAVYRRVRNAVLWNKPLRRLIYPVDLLVFLVYRVYVEKLRKQVLVMDRYFYDTLVDVAYDRSWGWLHLLQRITPTPDLAVFLDITPEESFARKGEYSVPYLQRRATAYRQVFRRVPGVV